MIKELFIRSNGPRATRERVRQQSVGSLIFDIVAVGVVAGVFSLISKGSVQVAWVAGAAIGMALVIVIYRFGSSRQT